MNVASAWCIKFNSTCEFRTTICVLRILTLVIKNKPQRRGRKPKSKMFLLMHNKRNRISNICIEPNMIAIVNRRQNMCTNGVGGFIVILSWSILILFPNEIIKNCMIAINYMFNSFINYRHFFLHVEARPGNFACWVACATAHCISHKNQDCWMALVRPIWMKIHKVWSFGRMTKFTGLINPDSSHW